MRLDDGGRIDARGAVAADGAESTLRQLAGGEVSRHDYGQRGVVAYIETGQPHEDTAWKRFLPTGPLAVLPFAGGRSSLVWTLRDARAAQVLGLGDDALAGERARATDAPLGGGGA